MGHEYLVDRLVLERKSLRCIEHPVDFGSGNEIAVQPSFADVLSTSDIEPHAVHQEIPPFRASKDAMILRQLPLQNTCYSFPTNSSTVRAGLELDLRLVHKLPQLAKHILGVRSDDLAVASFYRFRTVGALPHHEHPLLDHGGAGLLLDTSRVRDNAVRLPHQDKHVEVSCGTQ